MCDEREAEIAEAIGKDLGRPAFEAWLGDIGSTKAEAAFARKHLKKWVKPKRQGLPLAQLPGRAWVQYDPLGVILVIGPWNYPFYLCMAPLVGRRRRRQCGGDQAFGTGTRHVGRDRSPGSAVPRLRRHPGGRG